MKLLDVELENWAVHSRLQVPLRNSLQIEGRNGTGKSSIIEALRFIFAKDARNYRRKIKNGTRSSRVRLIFEDKGNEYLVEKSIHLKRPSEARMLVNSEMVASTPSETYMRLQEILPENVLDKLLYVPQDGLIELIENLRVKGGRQELDALLGLDRFEKVYKGVTEELNTKNLLFGEVSDRMKKYPEDAEKRYHERINELEKEGNELEEKIRRENAKLSSIESRIRDMNKEIQRVKELKKEKDCLDKATNDLKLKLAEDRKELEGLTQNLENLKERKTRLKSLEKAVKKLEKYALIREPLIKLRRQEEKLADLGDTAEADRELKALEDELKSLDDIEDRHSMHEADVLALEKETAKNKQRLEEHRSYIRNLAELTDAAKCPRCGQKLTKKHVEDETERTNKEVMGLEKMISDLTEKLKNSKRKLEETSSLLDELRRKEVKTQYLRTELKKRLAERDNTLERMKSLGKELKNLGFGDESMEFVESRVSELNSTRGEIAGIGEELRREESYTRRKENLGDELQRTKREIEENIGKSEGLMYDEKPLEELQGKREKLQHEAYSIQKTVGECTLKRDYNKESVLELQREKREFTDLKKREKDMTKEISLLREAQEIFHTNKGIVKYLRERYINQLGNYTSYYFRRINQNPKYREIAFDKEYNIEIKTREGVFSIDQLSGGEKVQLAIALRIALIELLSPIRLLMLDEPFGSLDREHREVLGEALNKIALDEQLILVTHVVVDSLNLPERLDLEGY